MNGFVIFLISLSLSSCATASTKDECKRKPFTVAVVDTGFGYQDRGHDAHLCKFGHKDFSKDKKFSTAYDTKAPVPIDEQGHGTNVAGLIDKYASKAGDNFCLVIVKYWSRRQTDNQNAYASILAFKYANNINASIVNYSGGGESADPVEKSYIEKYLGNGGKFVAAAGNEHKDLEKVKYYPAMYDSRIVVVGNVDSENNLAPSSNYGKGITVWENGVNQEVYNIKMTGTSQATAVTTGKTVADMQNKCDR